MSVATDDEEELQELDLSKIVTKAGTLNRPQQILIYGQYGSGKSWLAASAQAVEELAPVLYLDTESGTTGAISDFPDVDVISCDSYVKLNQIVNKLTDPKMRVPYNTVVVDTIDVAQDRALKYFEAHPLQPNNTYEKWARVQDWLTGADGLMHRLKAAPFLSIVVAHEREEKSQSGGLVSKIRLGGSSKDLIGGIPDIVGYMERKQTEDKKSSVSTLWLSSTDSRSSKSRFKLPPSVRDVTMSKLYKMIEESTK